MPRERYVWDREASELVPAADYYSRSRVTTRSGLPCPMFISDTAEFRSMADGKVYTSKAKYRADLRARGLEEVGTDTSWQRTPPPDPVAELPPVEQDLKRVFQQARSK